VTTGAPGTSEAKDAAHEFDPRASGDRPGSVPRDGDVDIEFATKGGPGDDMMHTRHGLQRLVPHQHRLPAGELRLVVVLQLCLSDVSSDDEAVVLEVQPKLGALMARCFDLKNERLVPHRRRPVFDAGGHALGVPAIDDDLHVSAHVGAGPQAMHCDDHRRFHQAAEGSEKK